MKSLLIELKPDYGIASLLNKLNLFNLDELCQSLFYTLFEFSKGMAYKKLACALLRI
jgi:hypothetical protein